MQQQNPSLTIELLLAEAEAFCLSESQYDNASLFGVTDGKAVGTYIEHKFHDQLAKYHYERGSSAKGVDIPSETINTDIKVTSVRQPQSSCPFQNPRQKIYGLGYNLLLFVYDKSDDPRTKTAQLEFINCIFIQQHRTGDYMMTKMLRQMVEQGANSEDIIAYLVDRNVPADEITLNLLATEILQNPPPQGYLTISNALQRRLQYGRVVAIRDEIEGIIPVISGVG